MTPKFNIGAPYCLGRFAKRIIFARPYPCKQRMVLGENANPIQIRKRIWRWFDFVRSRSKAKGHSSECPKNQCVALYEITAKPCMEFATCCSMELTRSVVWNQTEAKENTAYRLMPYSRYATDSIHLTVIPCQTFSLDK